MPANRVNYYEGMFLLSQAVAADLANAISHIRQIIEKAGGSIVAMRKWDERKLAYEIGKQKRAYYLLVYFQAPAVRLHEIERSCNLSELILRNLIVRADHMTLEQMQAADAIKELEAEAKLRFNQPTMTLASAQPAPAAAPDAEEQA
ncbi:MAG TPA: 30S ribosomal protein S6 [Phycisphaerales bacterium]|nr:30S ribosomal protein S6 [Phycisphaerales bacterium]